MGPGGAGLIGLALGTTRGLAEERKAERDRQLQAQTALWSPWTNMAPSKPMEADLSGRMMQGLTGGMEQGQGLEQYQAEQDYRQQNPDAYWQAKMSGWGGKR